MSTATKRIQEEHHNIWVFPEGTRNWLYKDTTLKFFKKGPFHMSLDSGAPVVPVVLDRFSKIIDLENLIYPGLGQMHLMY